MPHPIDATPIDVKTSLVDPTKLNHEEQIRAIALIAACSQTNASYYSNDVLARADKFVRFIKTGI